MSSCELDVLYEYDDAKSLECVCSGEVLELGRVRIGFNTEK